MLATSAPLVAVELIAASIWIGGMVCIAIVAKAARGVLDESSQVAFFRAVGRRYGMVGTASSPSPSLPAWRSPGHHRRGRESLMPPPYWLVSSLSQSLGG